MAVKTSNLPEILIVRAEAYYPAPAIFQADDVCDWPKGALQELLASEILMQASRATSADCHGCDWNCNKPVVVRRKPDQKSFHAFIQCNEQPRLGRIRVAPERLNRYQLSLSRIETAIRSALATKSRTFEPQPSPSIGIVRGRKGERTISVLLAAGQFELLIGKHRCPLRRILFWQRGLQVDNKTISRMADRKDPKSAVIPIGTKQSQRKQKTVTRNRRIWRIAQSLYAEGMSSTEAAEHIAKMDFIRKPANKSKPISAGRLRRILSEHRSS